MKKKTLFFCTKIGSYWNRFRFFFYWDVKFSIKIEKSHFCYTGNTSARLRFYKILFMIRYYFNKTGKSFKIFILTLLSKRHKKK